VAVPLNIPKLGVSMSEGTLVEWLVADGATVNAGDVIYRIETDKVENDVEAPADGVIHISGVEGETYDVGAEIGTIE
jgi:pyruvate/2-oxoglutarate dehydrogenase complex dihydrolipoamide acyltransferase (E2) component